MPSITPSRSLTVALLALGASGSIAHAQMTILEVTRSVSATADRVMGDGMDDTQMAAGPDDTSLWTQTVGAADQQTFMSSVQNEATASAHQTSSTSTSGAIVSGYIDAQMNDWAFDGFNPGGCFPDSTSSYSVRFSIAAEQAWSLAGALTLDNRGNPTPNVNQSVVTVTLNDSTGMPVYTETLCGVSPCATDNAVQINTGGMLAAGEYTLTVSAVATQSACLGPTATPSVGQRVSYNAVLTVGAGGAPPMTCMGDLNGDNAVDGQDLAGLLSGWGACP